MTGGQDRCAGAGREDHLAGTIPLAGNITLKDAAAKLGVVRPDEFDR